MPTPTAQDERVEVRALKGEYQFGFHDPDQSVFRAKRVWIVRSLNRSRR